MSEKINDYFAFKIELIKKGFGDLSNEDYLTLYKTAIECAKTAGLGGAVIGGAIGARVGAVTLPGIGVVPGAVWGAIGGALGYTMNCTFPNAVVDLSLKKFIDDLKK